MQKNNLTDSTYWDSEYRYATFASAPTNHPINQLIKKHCAGQSGSVFEVGCFPGTFLYTFGELGYQLNGIDTAPRLPEMISDMQQRGFHLGEFSRADFFNIPHAPQYNVVCSFGFIEHFIDFETVIKKHLDLVAPGGTLIITTPNFAGFYQYLAHKLTDQKNLARHNVASMNPERWAALCTEAGYTIIEAGYAGKFDFWVEAQERSWFEKIIFYLFAALGKILKRVIWFESKTFSPFCILVAKKV